MRTRAAWIAAMAISAGVVPGAYARLGEAEASIESDRAAMHGKPVLKIEKPGFMIHETRNPAQSVRQFVAKKHGLVFGLAWRGVSPPVALEKLTGKYYAEYAAAFRERADKTKGPLRVRVLRLETEHLVIARGGQGRALAGSVYVKDLLPPDVRPDEIDAAK